MRHFVGVTANQIAMLTNGKRSGIKYQLLVPLQVLQLQLFGMIGLHDGVRYFA